MAASKTRLDNSKRLSLDPRDINQVDPLLKASDVMRLSNYHADPIAAVMNNRSIGLSNLKIS